MREGWRFYVLGRGNGCGRGGRLEDGAVVDDGDVGAVDEVFLVSVTQAAHGTVTSPVITWCSRNE